MGLFNFFKKNKKTAEKIPKKQVTEKTNFYSLGEVDINSTYLERLPNGLLPGEIVLLSWMEGKRESANVPGYFQYTYGINTAASLEKLLSVGFIETASPVEALPSLKVEELKVILKDHDIKASGKKSELVKRIENSSIEVSRYINETFFKITDSGNNVLLRHYYIVPAHKNDSKDGVYCVATAIDFINDNNLKFKPNNGDISWALFQKDYLKNHSQKMYGLARNNLHAMAKQLQREQKLKYSLKQYLSVIIMDLSGLSNNANLDGPSLTTLYPGIIARIENIIKVDETDEKQLHNTFEEAWPEIRQSIPFHYLTKGECYESLTEALEGNYEYVNQAIVNSFEKIDRKTFEKEYGLRLPVSYT